MNRLLINMRNKIEVIDGAINQCLKLMNGEKIHLNGLHKMTITRGDYSDEWFLKRISELHSERENLSNRINRMGG